MSNVTLIAIGKRISGTKDGVQYDFLSWTTHDKKGKKWKLKFTKDCDSVPKKEGAYQLTTEVTNVNIDKSTVYRELWVRRIDEIEPYTPNYGDADEDVPF